MQIASLGALSIEVTPEANNPAIMNVDIGCETRKETMSMKTNRDETVDQFCTRIRSMLRSLINAEPRVLQEEQPLTQEMKPQTWVEQKTEMKRGPGRPPKQHAEL